MYVGKLESECGVHNTFLSIRCWSRLGWPKERAPAMARHVQRQVPWVLWSANRQDCPCCKWSWSPSHPWDQWEGAVDRCPVRQAFRSCPSGRACRQCGPAGVVPAVPCRAWVVHRPCGRTEGIHRASAKEEDKCDNSLAGFVLPNRKLAKNTCQHLLVGQLKIVGRNMHMGH